MILLNSMSLLRYLVIMVLRDCGYISISNILLNQSSMNNV